MKTPIQLLKYSLIAAAFAISQPAFSAASVLVWPIDPVLEDYQNASSVWLENKGTDSAYFQIRVFKWTQVNGEDRYENQKDIIVSPPFTTVEPKHKQLVRLVRDAAGKVAPGRENAYRILIDEIPKPASDNSKDAPSGLKYQMRYFIPLFSGGEGIWTKEDFNKKRNLKTMAMPLLSAKVIKHKNTNWLEVHNNGVVHARLSNLETMLGNNKVMAVIPGLVGYVLPNSTMRFPLPDNANVSTTSKFRAAINNQKDPVTLM